MKKTITIVVKISNGAGTVVINFDGTGNTTQTVTTSTEFTVELEPGRYDRAVGGTSPNNGYVEVSVLYGKILLAYMKFSKPVFSDVLSFVVPA
jgi:hypothetical protein